MSPSEQELRSDCADARQFEPMDDGIGVRSGGPRLSARRVEGLWTNSARPALGPIGVLLHPNDATGAVDGCGTRPMRTVEPSANAGRKSERVMPNPAFNRTRREAAS